MMYAVHKDDFCKTLVVIFGTEEDIAGGVITHTPPFEKFRTLLEELDDSGELCEDYLIVSKRFTDEAQISEVKAIVEAHGFVENASLIDCGWG